MRWTGTRWINNCKLCGTDLVHDSLSKEFGDWCPNEKCSTEHAKISNQIQKHIDILQTFRRILSNPTVGKKFADKTLWDAGCSIVDDK